MTARRPSRVRFAAAALAVVSGVGCRSRQPAAPPPDPAAGFLGQIYLRASNQPGGRGEMMWHVERADYLPAAPLDLRMVYGPGGHAQSVRVDGDSLVVAWGFRDGAPDYHFVLRRTQGDSVVGTWAGKEGGGALHGRRTPTPG